MTKILIHFSILIIFFSAIIIFLHRQPKIETLGASTVIEQQASPTPEATPVALPKKLKIEKIQVDAQVEEVGLDKENKMDVPKLAQNVGWYNLGPKPGEQGNVVIDGHLDSKVGPAVFYNLGKIVKGDKIQVTTDTGTTYTYIVTKKESYPFDNFPLQVVFGPSNEFNLNLITCAGSFDKKAKNYSQRTVIYSTLTR